MDSRGGGGSVGRIGIEQNLLKVSAGSTVSDVFFSYSSSDRERVRLAYNALAARQIAVFWDQTLPPGENWDAWIRGHLARAKVAIVFWSRESVKSRNVRDEANLAFEQQKLLPVVLDILPNGDLPVGLGTTQCANLVQWRGDPDDPHWEELAREIENRIIPLFAKLKIDQAERRADNINERAMRAAVLADERHGGLLASLKDVEQKLAVAKLDLDVAKARGDALDSQLSTERATAEKLNADLLQRIATKDVEIGSLLEKTDAAVAEKIQQQDKEIRTLQIANEALRQRLYQAAETKSTQETDEATLKALRSQLSMMDEERTKAASALAESQRNLALLQGRVREADEIRQQFFGLQQRNAELESSLGQARGELHRPAPGVSEGELWRWKQLAAALGLLALFCASFAVVTWYDADGKAERATAQANAKLSEAGKAGERLAKQLEEARGRERDQKAARDREVAALTADRDALRKKGVELERQVESFDRQLRDFREIPVRRAETPPPEGQPQSRLQSRYATVIASERSRELALQRLQELQRAHPDVQDLPSDVREANLAEKGLWYRALLGSFDTADGARELCNKLKGRGTVSCWVSPY